MDCLSCEQILKISLNSYSDVMDLKEMCNVLKVSKKTGYKLLKENKIKHFKIGRVYRIPKIFICSYLDCNG